VRRIRWTTEAVAQLEDAVRHIRTATLPGIGRPGEVQGTRELVSAPYVIVYRSTEEIVEILHIRHGAQDWR
jgi:toxin ParE1/3/4